MKSNRFLIALAGVALLGGACDRDEPKPPATTGSRAANDDGAPGATSRAIKPTEPVTATGPRVVFLGDSITAGFGLDAEQAYPALVGQALAAEGLPARIVNAGVSGDTTAGGLRRLDWLLRQKPDVVVVGLGGNDGLRGLDLKSSEANLREIVSKSRAAGADVLLLGMLVPPNYGPEYAGQFKDLYPRLARELGVPLVPFLLEGVGGDPRLNLPDGIHPTPEGHQIVARNVLGAVRPLVSRRAERPSR